MSIQTAVIIPARYASTRFPGKPLALIKNRSMIERVFERCVQAEKIDIVMVATDDNKIFSHVHEFGGEAVMTSPDAASGSDRIFEAIQHPELLNAEIIINVQGDEPFIPPSLIDELVIFLLQNPDIPVVTAVCPLPMHELTNPNVVKVVTRKQHEKYFALYFSRSPIPYQRDSLAYDDLAAHPIYWQHIGLYGYRRSALVAFHELPKGELEKLESLEQLRMLEAGWQIGIIRTNYSGLGVDTPEDIARAETLILDMD